VIAPSQASPPSTVQIIVISVFTSVGIGRTEIDASVDEPDVNATVPPEDVQAPLPPVPLCEILSSVTPQVFATVVKSVDVVIEGVSVTVTMTSSVDVHPLSCVFVKVYVLVLVALTVGVAEDVELISVFGLQA
jgi:hypothetical protein